MKKTLNSFHILMICVLMFFAWAPVSNALIITLSASTSYSLTGPDGGNLAEGSVVLIVGSFDSIADPMVEFGGGLLSYSFTGDDIFVGLCYVLDDGTIDAGGFKYESSLVNYLYLRFFDAAEYPVQGVHAWGTTDVWGVTNQFQYVSLDFAPEHGYGVGHTNNFVIIPEADTRNYFGMVLMLGLVWAAAGEIRRKKNRLCVRNS
ncbi:MAG TPA: hypothetical protein DCZ95_06320 [Verrucomicrobia bacterium]|nr:MAG: hypothetical protein A2X46_08265 [Lentisphaerae bacterium GWF2_57_35]HBA83693.1 hypothetical protein [Verrucomicrobiota bacterium]